MSVYLTARGFPVPVSPQFESFKDGVPKLNELLMRLDTPERNGIDFTLDVVDFAKTVFCDDKERRGLKPWLAFHLTHHQPSMSHLHYEFIKQTLRFVQTGFRRVSPYTMLQIWKLDHNADKKLPEQQLIKQADIQKWLNEMLNEIDDELNQTFLSQWVNQPDGVTDLLATLFYLFGGNHQDIDAKAINPVLPY